MFQMLLHIFVIRICSLKETKNVMVVTSWRSGSTLIGELLNSYPKSYYSYEPLDHLRIRRAYAADKDAQSADKVVKGLLTCDYTPVFQECKYLEF